MQLTVFNRFAKFISPFANNNIRQQLAAQMFQQNKNFAISRIWVSRNHLLATRQNLRFLLTAKESWQN